MSACGQWKKINDEGVRKVTRFVEESGSLGVFLENGLGHYFRVHQHGSYRIGRAARSLGHLQRADPNGHRGFVSVLPDKQAEKPAPSGPTQPDPGPQGCPHAPICDPVLGRRWERMDTARMRSCPPLAQLSAAQLAISTPFPKFLPPSPPVLPQSPAVDSVGVAGHAGPQS
jgi:hypothetical protein